jgi:hypothetical protein
VKRVLESQIERRHRQIARRAGWFVEKLLQTSMGGFPDRFYAKDGRVVLLEWKRPGGKVTPQQRLRHEQLRRAGVEVHVVRSLDEANGILQLEDRGGSDADTSADDL